MYEKVPGAEVFLDGKLSLTRRKKTEICNIRGEYHINRDWSQKNKEIECCEECRMLVIHYERECHES